MEETRALFRDPEATQFVIVTIPTAMAAAESARLAKALLEQQVRQAPWCLHMHCCVLKVSVSVSESKDLPFVHGRQLVGHDMHDILLQLPAGGLQCQERMQ